MEQPHTPRGFTLIELLVVIAIIGILASIVLVALSGARSRGSDAGIQGSLDTIRTQTELYAINNGNAYNPTVAVGAGNARASTAVSGATCFSTMTVAQGIWGDPTIRAAIIAAANNSAKATLADVANSGAVCIWGPASAAAKAATYWVVAAPLQSNNAQAWCVDSTGNAKLSTIAGNFDTAANAAAKVVCP